MVKIDPKTLSIITKFIEGKKYLRLTIGFLASGKSYIRVYTENGEINKPKKYYYEIGSITKTFTTSMLAKYIFENELALNDPLHKHIEGISSSSYYPSLRRLATHTSGYPSNYPVKRTEPIEKMFRCFVSGGYKKYNPFSEDVNIDNIKEYIKSRKLKNKDYTYSYSNLGLGLLGHALGNVSGEGYSLAMEKFLKNELELCDTYIGVKKKNLHGYDGNNEDNGNWKWTENNFFIPAGGLSSTAQDMLKYADLNINGSRPYLYFCHKKHSKGTRKYDMGLGWQLHKKDNIIWHDGATGCFHSFLGFDKQKKVATVALSNYSCNSINNIGFSMLNHLQAIN